MTDDASSNNPAVTEDELHAWVDDRLDPARRDAVDAHLRRNPAVLRRVEDWTAQSAELRRALRQQDEARRDTLRLALIQRLPAASNTPGRATPRRAAAAAIVLALGVGGLGGWLAHGPERPPTEIGRLGVEAATTYRIVNAGGAGPAGNAIPVADRAELRATMAERLGRRVPLPDLSAMGYRLVDGRTVAAIYGPAAMLEYRDDEGNRLTVYLQPMAVGEPASMRPVGTETLSGYAWIDGRIGYTVMSEDGGERARRAADRVMAEVRP